MLQDLLVVPADLDQLDLPEVQDLRVNQAHQVSLVAPALLDLKEHRDPRDQLVLREDLALPVPPDLLDPLELLDLLEFLPQFSPQPMRSLPTRPVISKRQLHNRLIKKPHSHRFGQPRLNHLGLLRLNLQSRHRNLPTEDDKPWTISTI